MSSDARTLPFGDAVAGAHAARWRGRSDGRAEAAARSRARVWIGGLALVLIVALSALLVVIVADRPSGLSPTTHANYFPHWMAGPLGGLWPGLTRSATTVKYVFSGAVALMYAGYLVALACAPQLRARWAIGAIVAAHAIFFCSPPLALTDIFNYINYGRMEVVHHLNPYTTTPIFEPHYDPSFALSNWHQLLSPYGPLFTLLSFAVVPLGVAASFWVLKGVLALASLATIALVFRCARLLGRDPVAAIVLTGLNPIVLVWGLGGDHNDFLMVLFIVLGFYLLLLAHTRADVGAGAAFVTAVAIKASAGVLLPVVLAGVISSPARVGRVVLGMAAAAAALAIASLVAFGLHIPDLSTQSRLVTNFSVPNLTGLAVGAGGETASLHVVLSVVLIALLIGCCVLALRAQSSLAASGWASVALLLTLSWVLPWYVLWVLPLAALSSSRRLRAVALALGVYLILAWAPASAFLWNAIGFHPDRTSLGRLHERDVKELLN